MSAESRGQQCGRRTGSACERDHRLRCDRPRGLGGAVPRAARDAPRRSRIASVRGSDPRRGGDRHRHLDRSPDGPLGRGGAANRRRRPRRHPLRRRPAHRRGTFPAVGPADPRPRGRRDVPDGRRGRARRSLRARVQLDRGWARRRGDRTDGSGGHVLRLRGTRDPRALGHDPRRRGGNERPGRDRAHDRDDRARTGGRRQPLDRRPRVRGRDGRRARRGDRRSRFWSCRSSAGCG